MRGTGSGERGAGDPDSRYWASSTRFCKRPFLSDLLRRPAPSGLSGVGRGHVSICAIHCHPDSGPHSAWSSPPGAREPSAEQAPCAPGRAAATGHAEETVLLSLGEDAPAGQVSIQPADAQGQEPGRDAARRPTMWPSSAMFTEWVHMSATALSRVPPSGRL